MPIIDLQVPPRFTLVLRIVSGLVWFFTVVRRILSGLGTFEDRITSMGEGKTLLPAPLMDFAIRYWWVIFTVVFTLELLASISLLTGTFARAGALLATIDGFGIGMAGIGLGLVDLIIPWSVAVVTLFLFLFTHPGRYHGYDTVLSQRTLPVWLSWWT